MRIGVSALALRGSVERLDSGIARYCAALVEAWAADSAGHEVVVWTAPGFEPPAGWRRAPRLSFESANGPWASYKTLWEWFSAGSAARAHGCEVWFSTAHALPLRPPVPAVLSVQDLFTFSHPELYTRKHRLVVGSALRRAIRQADGLVAISAHTKSELQSRFAVPGQRVTVTPLGWTPRPAAPDPEAAGVGPPGRFLLTLSTVEPRKNLPRLFEAFARLTEDPRWADLRLAVVGRRGWKTAESYARPAELGIADRVDFLGFVPDEELPGLFARCEAFVLPSIAEGFGLPLLEAMASGAPVVCSRAGALPEVGGDVPLYFDPLDVDDMVRALRRRLAGEVPREELAARGRRRSARYSWRETADATLAALESAGGAPARDGR